MSFPFPSIEVFISGSCWLIGGFCCLMAPGCYYSLKFNKENPDIARLSRKELKELSDELISKKKELNDSINEIANSINEYETMIGLCDMTEECVESLGNFDYAIKNAKNKDEYIEMCEKQEFFKNEWNEFVNEPVDYRNIDLEVKNVDNVRVKKLVKNHSKN